MNIEQTLLELREQAGNFTRTDGFRSRELRSAIITLINAIPLPAEESNELKRPHQDEKPRRDFLRLAAAAGEKFTMEFAMERLSPALDDFLQALVKHGASNLGHRIGLEYGYAVYPVAKYRRDHRITVPQLASEPIPAPGSYFGFSITTDGMDRTLSDVIPVKDSPGSTIEELDDDSAAIREIFVFADHEQAEAARVAWANYIAGERMTAPVAYAIQVTVPPDGTELEPLVGWVEHVTENSASDEYATQDGIVVTSRVYHDLDAALSARRCLIRKYYAGDAAYIPADMEHKIPAAPRIPSMNSTKPAGMTPIVTGKSGKEINH